jgi:aryl-alcohol dehydrogenase-like predicted oxidoreductase
MQIIASSAINFGLGLIGIGREWGHADSLVPDEKDVRSLLEYAFRMGVAFFDTAPSYGMSEARLGAFLTSLSQTERKRITVASKWGDHWDAQTNTSFVDHSYSALCASLDQSLARLGKIDLLQLHKTNPSVLRSDDLYKAMEFAKTLGINKFGASVSDDISGGMVCAHEAYSSIQLPFSKSNTKFEPIIDKAIDRKKLVIINRPFQMGKMFHSDATTSVEEMQIDAYRFIMRRHFRGIILTGTKSCQHLQANWDAFQIAKS